MVQDKQLEFVKFKNIMRKLVFTVGLWTKEDSSFLHRSLLIIYLLFYIIPVIGACNFLITNISNISLATRAVTQLLGFLTVTLKAACFIINRKDANDLHSVLDLYFEKLLHSPKMSNMVLGKVRTFRRWPTFITTFVTIVCMSYAIIPIISIVKQLRHRVWPIQYNLLYLTIYPMKARRSSLLYNFYFFDEYVMTISMIFITSSLDSLFTYYIFQLIGMLREISYHISIIDDKNGEIIVRQCVDKYQVLLKACNQLRKIYGPIILWTMNVNALILCAAIFQLSIAKTIPVISMIIFAAHASLKLVQVYVYAWSGTQLTIESEKFRESIYAANWAGNARLKSSIIIMLAQKPLILTACGLLNVTIEMFVKVINTSVSYFLLLKTFDQKV
ncbi:odorant receptor 4-like [Cotesia glomerata]|uniref:odorant receptor 4-like n=1 Tax=Cotesia glomerata TaxID=32391 RepID=UPI001D02B582|nr:odorant receptor 4-like [Cotesia glomerata]